MLLSGYIARVVEWHTRTTQNRVPQGLWVQVPPRAQFTLSIFYLFSIRKHYQAGGIAVDILVPYSFACHQIQMSLPIG